MKAVLISIQPKWVGEIASGEKTIEVRKTAPKLGTPFKCYIYCTKTGDRLFTDGQNVFDISKELTGKVIGEFVCDEIFEVFSYGIIKRTCLTEKELDDYLKNSDGYGWHISNLKIYDKPKELSEFRSVKIIRGYHREGEKGLDRLLHARRVRVKQITRPPQSFFYVEEL